MGRTRPNTTAISLLAAALLAGCAGAGGASGFDLGARDPNATPRFAIEKGGPATPAREGPLRFWSVPTYELDYSSGGRGRTARLHVSSGDHPQAFTWRSQRGYLAAPGDPRDLELIVYLRVRGIVDPERAAVALKVRGGRHTASDGDLASCVMMTFQAATTGALARFGKELTHPLYDYVKLTPHPDPARAQQPRGLEDGRWVGLKLVSTNLPGGGARHRLFVDDDPWTAAGQPRHAWAPFSEYDDLPGRRTGRYDTAADWAGAVTTVRVDGVERVDFAIVSVRPLP